MGWTPADIAWDRFDPDRVDPDILRIVKAASLVEYNGRDYAAYLAGVFQDDPEFIAVAEHWAAEEVQHGEVLARWAMMADPAWDHAMAQQRFRDGYKLPIGVDQSTRGTRTGELISRCIVETGTSSYYTALAEATQEPVLRQICLRIAADEHRHYKLFYSHMQRYQEREKLGRRGRLWAGFSRILESEDDELAYAYYAANESPDQPYRRRTYSRAYARRAFAVYRPRHVERGTAMALKAVGLNPQGRLARFLARASARFMDWRVRRLARAGA